MEKKKLLFVIESLHLGGAEKSLVTLLSNLDYNRLSVDLLLFNRGGIFEKFVPPQVRILDGKNPQLSIIDRIVYKAGKTIRYNNLHEAQIFWHIAGSKTEPLAEKYDVAIAYNQQFATYYVAEKVKAIKKYAWMNTLYKNAGYSVGFDSPYFKKFEKLVGVSEQAHDNMKSAFERAGYPLQTALVKDIIDSEIIRKQAQESQPIPFSNDVINIVTVCRLAAPKGLELAVQAAEILKNEGYKFRWYVIGEGEERNKIETLVKERSLENYFFLPGSTDNPFPYVQNADIYVQTSLVEGLGMSVIEAVVLGKPVVCTDFDTAASIVQPGDIITEKKPEKIAEGIKFFIDKPESRIRQNTSVQMIEKDKEKSLKEFYKLIDL